METLLGTRKSKQKTRLEWACWRQRAFTLLIKRYEEVRRAVLFVRCCEGDADSIAPSLWAGRGRRNRKTTQPTASASEPEAAPASPEVPQLQPAAPATLPEPLQLHPTFGPNGPFMPTTSGRDPTDLDRHGDHPGPLTVPNRRIPGMPGGSPFGGWDKKKKRPESICCKRPLLTGRTTR